MKRRQFLNKLGSIVALGAIGKIGEDSQSYFKPNPDYVDAPYECYYISLLPPSDILLMCEETNIPLEMFETSTELIFKRKKEDEPQKPTPPTSSL